MKTPELIETLQRDLDAVNADIVRSHAVAMKAPDAIARNHWMGIHAGLTISRVYIQSYLRLLGAQEEN
jgi:hypothetical protein